MHDYHFHHFGCQFLCVGLHFYVQNGGYDRCMYQHRLLTCSSTQLLCIQQQTSENLNPIGRRKCERIMEEKNTISAKVVCIQMLEFNSNNLCEKLSPFFSLKNYVTSERAVSQHVLYHQQLPIAW